MATNSDMVTPASNAQPLCRTMQVELVAGPIKAIVRKNDVEVFGIFDGDESVRLNYRQVEQLWTVLTQARVDGHALSQQGGS